MTSFEFLAIRLKEMALAIPGLSIKYEYDRFRQDHIIEVEPLELYSEDSVYAIAETQLSLEFSKLFPLESIMFVSIGSLVQVENPDMEFIGQIVDYLVWSPPAPSFEPNYENSDYEYDLYPEYALAA
jgi:hypothetical protein